MPKIHSWKLNIFNEHFIMVFENIFRSFRLQFSTLYFGIDIQLVDVARDNLMIACIYFHLTMAILMNKDLSIIKCILNFLNKKIYLELM